MKGHGVFSILLLLTLSIYCIESTKRECKITGVRYSVLDKDCKIKASEWKYIEDNEEYNISCRCIGLKIKECSKCQYKETGTTKGTTAATTATPTGEASTATPTGEASTATPTDEASTVTPTDEASTATPTGEASTGAPTGEASTTTGESSSVSEQDATDTTAASPVGDDDTTPMAGR